MKKLEFDLGGRPLANDDLQTLQDEQSAATLALLANAGPCIVSGCQISGPVGGPYTVSAGLVYLDGELLRYYGGSNVTLPAQFQRGSFDFLDERPYENSTTKPCIRERPAVLVATNAGYAAGEFLPLQTWGGKRWAHVLGALGRSIGEMQPLAGYVAGNYDTTGKGKPGTEAWGWALCNGGNGTVSMNGRFPVGHDAARPDYSSVGSHGGAERVSLQPNENARHSHVMDSAGSHTHNVNTASIVKTSDLGDDRWGLDPGQLTHVYPTTPAGDHVHVIQDSGSGDPHENRPPWTVLVFRQWVGLS